MHARRYAGGERMNNLAEPLRTPRAETHHAGLVAMLAKAEPPCRLAVNPVAQMWMGTRKRTSAHSYEEDVAARWAGASAAEVWGLGEDERIVQYEGVSGGSLYPPLPGQVAGERMGWAVLGMATTSRGRALWITMRGTIRSCPGGGAADSSTRPELHALAEQLWLHPPTADIELWLDNITGLSAWGGAASAGGSEAGVCVARALQNSERCAVGASCAFVFLVGWVVCSALAGRGHLRGGQSMAALERE